MSTKLLTIWEEYQVIYISYIFHNLDNINELDEKYIVNKKYNALLKACFEMKKQALTFDFLTLELILKEKEYNFEGNVESLIEDAHIIYDNYKDFANIETFVIPKLKEIYNSEELTKNYIKLIGATDTKSELIDKNIIKEFKNNINEKIDDIIFSGKDDLILDTQDIYNTYVDILEQRKQGITTFSLGYSCFDKIAKIPAEPSQQTCIVAPSGTGKTILSMGMQNILINKGVPVLNIQAELNSEQTIDRQIILRTGISMDKIRSSELSDQEYRQVTGALRSLSQKQNYLFSPVYGFDIAKLDKIIKRSLDIFTKRKIFVGRYKDGYMYVNVDLFTQLKELSTGNAQDIEEGVNYIFDNITKKYGIHLCAVVQANENKFRSGAIKINKPEDVKFLSFDKEDIKNSSMFTERFRHTIFLYRPKEILLKKFPHIQDEIEAEYEDILYAQFIKNNYGKPLRCSFLFDEQTFQLSEYKETKTNEDKMEDQ